MLWKKTFPFFSVSVLVFSLTLVGCSKMKFWNSIIMLSNQPEYGTYKKFFAERESGIGKIAILGLIRQIIRTFLKQNIFLAELLSSVKTAKIFLFPLTWKLPREQRKCFGFLAVMIR